MLRGDDCAECSSNHLKNCFLHNVEKLCNLSEVFYIENVVNQITRMDSMEIVWRHCSEWYFNGDFLAKVVWRLSGCSSAFTFKLNQIMAA